MHRQSRPERSVCHPEASGGGHLGVKVSADAGPEAGCPRMFRKTSEYMHLSQEQLHYLQPAAFEGEYLNIDF